MNGKRNNSKYPRARGDYNSDEVGSVLFFPSSGGGEFRKRQRIIDWRKASDGLYSRRENGNILY